MSSRSNAPAQSATFQSQLKVAKVVLLLGGNISCMFSGGSRCLGISLFGFLEVLPKVSSCMFFLFLVGIVNRHRQECTQARSRLNQRADFGRQEQKEPSSNQQLEQQCLNAFAFVPALENRALRKLFFFGTRIKSKKCPINPAAETRGHDGIHSLSHLLGCRSLGDFIMYSLLPIVQTSIIFKAK